MSPSPLHPRSTATSTLFASTLAASFIIVAIPHIFPCPRPVTHHYDSNGRPIRKRSLPEPDTRSETVGQSPGGGGRDHPRLSAKLHEEAAVFRQLQDEAERRQRQTRECPVPKPRGLLGQLLGFEDEKTKGENTRQSTTNQPDHDSQAT